MSELTRETQPAVLMVRVDPGPRDFAALNEAVRKGSRIANEHLDDDDHLNEVIPKPWGMEYRIFVDDFIDVWNLRINAGESTSMHVHPRKLTYLLCLAEGVTDTLTDQIPVSPERSCGSAGARSTPPGAWGPVRCGWSKSRRRATSST